MGHINLAIEHGHELKWYILSYAEDMGEVWLAKVNVNETSKIIKEFRCRKFEDCFRELKRIIEQLGEVKQMNSSGIHERDMLLFEYKVLSKNDGILPVNSPKSDGKFWNWLQNDSYMIL